MKIKLTWALIALLFVGLFVSCKDDDETVLVGNWVETTQFRGVPRANSEVVVIGDTAYLIGGEDRDGFIKETWKFNSETNQWTRKADFPGIARRGAVAFSINGKAYYGTGYDGKYKKKDFWSFDPTQPDTLQWKQVANFGGDARYGAVAFSANGNGFVGAGYVDGSTNDFWKYDPVSDTWTSLSGTPDRKFHDGIVFVINNIAYIGTGINNLAYEDVFSSYDAATDTWTTLKKLNVVDSYTISRSNGVAFSLNGKGYVGTGNKNGIRSDFWEYDPVLDTWKAVTSFEGSARLDAAAFTIGNKAIVATGRNGEYYFDDVWYFEPGAAYNSED